jgi:hypothetical protein
MPRPISFARNRPMALLGVGGLFQESGRWDFAPMSSSAQAARKWNVDVFELPAPAALQPDDNYGAFPAVLSYQGVRKITTDTTLFSSNSNFFFFCINSDNLYVDLFVAPVFFWQRKGIDWQRQLSPRNGRQAGRRQLSLPAAGAPQLVTPAASHNGAGPRAPEDIDDVAPPPNMDADT